MKNRNSFLLKSGLSDWFASMIFVYGSIARTLGYWKFIGPSTSLISSFTNMFIKMLGIMLTILPLAAFTFITPLFFDGPVMSIFSDYTAEACLRSFGANFLFIQNNYRPIIDMCLPQTWSVAVEFQILPVIILLVHLYKRSPKLAVIINSLIVIAGLLYTGISAFIKDSHPHPIIRSLDVRPVTHWFENVYLQTPMIVWLYTLAPLGTYFIMNKYEKSNPILFTSCNKLLAALLLTLHILPSFWVLLENHVHPPFLNFIYFIFYRLCTGAVFTFPFMCNSDSLREFFSHPLDKEIFNENNNCINNSFEPSSEKEIDQVVQTDEDNAVTQFSKKISSGQKNRLLHFCSTLWRSVYYVHLSMIILRYSIQRWSLNSVEAFFSIIIDCVALTFFAAFFFQLFVVGPVTSFIETIIIKLKPQLKLKAK
uniref:Acyltransferase 3 domain-containing protein n=1 Tax=Tetranychus urticae TaxID=32264 RepID=T1KSQ6_TETUR